MKTRVAPFHETDVVTAVVLVSHVEVWGGEGRQVVLNSLFIPRLVPPGTRFCPVFIITLHFFSRSLLVLKGRGSYSQDFSTIFSS